MPADSYFRRNNEPKRINLVHRLSPTPMTPAIDPMEVVKNSKAQLVDADGTITEEAGWLMRQLFSWDYMGSTEFETGASPYALIKMQQERLDYVIESTVIARSLAKPDRLFETMKGHKPADTPEAMVWFLCRKNHVRYIQEILPFIVSGVHRTDERVGLDRAVRFGIIPGESYQTIGWLDLNNGSFWSLDERLVRAMGLFICKITS